MVHATTPQYTVAKIIKRGDLRCLRAESMMNDSDVVKYLKGITNLLRPCLVQSKLQALSDMTPRDGLVRNADSLLAAAK